MWNLFGSFTELFNCCCFWFADSSSRGVFYFGHAESLVPVFAALGLFHDLEPLRADTFDNRSLADARKFRTGAFVPFSGNFAFVLYDCAKDHGSTARRVRSDVGARSLDGGKSNFVANVTATDRFFVQLLVNERPMNFPSFCGGSVCSYSELRKHYSSYVDRCRFDELCQV